MLGDALTIADASKAFSRQIVFEGLSLSIPTGTHVSLVGQNGSGKTTLLRIILGLEHLNAGSVSTPAQFRGASYVPQDYRNAFLPWLPLTSNLQIALRHNRAGSADAQAAAERRFGDITEKLKITLDLKKYPTQLSGGEQQIFLIARALIADPELLVLDEPFSAVDYARRQLIRGLLSDHIGNARTTTVVSSHDFEDAVFLADRVLVLSRMKSGVAATVDVAAPWPRPAEFRDTALCRACVSDVTTAVLET